MTPTPEARISPPKTKKLYWVISLTLAGVLLYWSLRGIQWGRVGTILANARLLYVASCVLLVSVSLFLRAMRWRVLLLAQGNVSVPSAFRATAAGYFGNSFLPARAGEIVRTMMISSGYGLGRMFVLTTALSERLVDAIVLVSVSACVLLVQPSKPDWLTKAATPFAIAGFIGVVAITVLPLLAGFWESLIRRLPISAAIQEKLSLILHNILRGFQSFHHPQRLLSFLAYTAIIWLLDAVTTVVGAQSLGLSISLPLAFLLIAGLGLGSALPSTPGYVGVYQFVAVSVLTPFGFQRDDAIAYILLFQAIQYVVIGCFGVIALWGSRKGSTAAVPAPQP